MKRVRGEKREILRKLELIRKSLSETISETEELKDHALIEEVLIELEKMSEICSNALKNANEVERLVKKVLA